MVGLHSALPDSHLVRRVITRADDAGGEDYDAVSQVEFDELAENGAFAIHWRAHGLSYGIPVMIKYQLGQGKDCLVNFSRKALLRATSIFPNLVILNVTAAPETIAKRLVSRNRETKDEIDRRLAEADKALPDGLDVRHLPNDGPLSETVARGIALLRPEAGLKTVRVHQTNERKSKSESVS